MNRTLDPQFPKSDALLTEPMKAQEMDTDHETLTLFRISYFLGLDRPFTVYDYSLFSQFEYM